ncbi:MAG TPA: cytochrome c-type biogenesis CcmF C-terminal domain-containing protein, partial [Pseudomonadales bacterium]|nr:cytochrome c-type biogenesis CcmF C-terminal domain-containing protein [Pseudomonadales bacterium]
VIAILLVPLLLLALKIPFSVLAVLAAWLGGWVVASTLLDLHHKIRNAHSITQGLRSLRPAYWGMCIAHIGLAVSAMGIAFTSLASEQRDIRLAPGESAEVAGYVFNFRDMQRSMGPNYSAQHGVFYVRAPNADFRDMQPEKRQYMASGKTMTEAAIWPGFTRDIYISLGEPLQPELGEASAWSVRLHVKPAVRWIWLGAILMALGASTSVLDKRYRHKNIHGDSV